ncbi:MAG: FAD-dependent oxidoreductase [Alphaproteobacteria bacterium]|nr:FAD-dependent oxidoreductase [Alphaproteobacteria bacterium]
MSREQIKADLAVIGAGSAGLVTSAGAAMLGRKVVLFEPGAMGGDCLNFGCVPSKAILTAAHKAHEVRTAAKWGVQAGEPTIDFAQVRQHIAQAIAAIEPNDSQERFEGLGVRVIRERARFADERTLVSDSAEVSAKRIVIATGARARIPSISGMDKTPYLTNETIWDLAALPEHLVILGAGPIGMELGQAFARLGSEVTILEAGAALARLEPEHADLAVESLKADGVRVIVGTRAQAVAPSGEGIKVKTSLGEVIEGSHLLVAIGRQPNVEGLDLEKAGIETDAGGLVTDDKLRTTNKKVFAAGDIAGKGALTHLAGWHGSVIVRNLYFGVPTKQSGNPIPQAVYTDPPLTSIGLTEAEAREKHGDTIQIARWSFEENDRAIAEGDTRGGVKIVVGKGGKLLGVHAAGARADDLVQIAQAVMVKKGTIRDLTSPVAPYPTRGEIFKRAAGKYYEPTVFGPFAKAWSGLLTLFH